MPDAEIESDVLPIFGEGEAAGTEADFTPVVDVQPAAPDPDGAVAEARKLLVAECSKPGSTSLVWAEFMEATGGVNPWKIIFKNLPAAIRQQAETNYTARLASEIGRMFPCACGAAAEIAPSSVAASDVQAAVARRFQPISASRSVTISDLGGELAAALLELHSQHATSVAAGCERLATAGSPAISAAQVSSRLAHLLWGKEKSTPHVASFIKPVAMFIVMQYMVHAGLVKRFRIGSATKPKADRDYVYVPVSGVRNLCEYRPGSRTVTVDAGWFIPAHAEKFAAWYVVNFSGTARRQAQDEATLPSDAATGLVESKVLSMLDVRNIPIHTNEVQQTFLQVT